MENAEAQAKSEGQNIHGTFEYKTGAYLSQMGGGTLRWHTPLSRPFNRERLCKNQGKTRLNAEDRGNCFWIVLDSCGVFAHYDGTQKWGGSKNAITSNEKRCRGLTPLVWHKCIVFACAINTWTPICNSATQ